MILDLGSSIGLTVAHLAVLLAGGPAWLDRGRSLTIEVHPPATVESISAVLREHGFRWPASSGSGYVAAIRS